MTSERPSGCTTNPLIVPTLATGRRKTIVSILKALGDETRLEIFRLIAGQNEPICVCDIVDRFEISQPTVSHHLRILREAGLVHVTRRANWAFYELEPSGVAEARVLVSGLLPGVLQPT